MLRSSERIRRKYVALMVACLIEFVIADFAFIVPLDSPVVILLSVAIQAGLDNSNVSILLIRHLASWAEADSQLSSASILGIIKISNIYMPSVAVLHLFACNLV